MTCEQVQELASVWIDGEADSGSLKKVMNHAVSCPACLEFLELLPRQIRHTRMLRNPAEEETAGIADRPGIPRRATWGTFEVPIRVLAAAAILLMILTFAVTLNLGSPSTDRAIGTTAVERTGR